MTQAGHTVCFSYLLLHIKPLYNLVTYNTTASSAVWSGVSLSLLQVVQMELTGSPTQQQKTGSLMKDEMSQNSFSHIPGASAGMAGEASVPWFSSKYQISHYSILSQASLHGSGLPRRQKQKVPRLFRHRQAAGTALFLQDTVSVQIQVDGKYVSLQMRGVPCMQRWKSMLAAMFVNNLPQYLTLDSWLLWSSYPGGTST